MANDIQYIPQIDYTSKDYSSIREDLIALIPGYTDKWTSRDPADFGMVMVELFSYMGDLLTFYIDRAANEGFLATASQRDSVLQIAAMLGYIPTTTSPATATLTFSNSTSSVVTIPALTQIATTTIVNGLSTQIIFETDSTLTVPAKTTDVNGVTTPGSSSVTATQGVTITSDSPKTSTGAPNQVIALVQSPVIKNSISAVSNGTTYTYTSSLIDAGTYDPVFTTYNDAAGITYVVFGDGVNGKIPASGQSITFTYRIGNGSAGNVLPNKLTYILNNTDIIGSGVTVTNANTAGGGADEESTDSIRTNAPQALRSLNRAVSLKDFAYLALQVTGIAKAVADSSTYSSVNLYIAPFGDTGYASGYSGTTSAAFNTAAQNVGTYMTGKALPNVTVTVLPPTYVPVDLGVTVSILPQYKQSLVINQALAAVRNLFSLDNTFFADRIPSQYILAALNSIPGIDYAQITSLTRITNITYWSRSTTTATIWFPATTGTNLTTGSIITVAGITDVGATINGTNLTVTGTTTATISSVAHVGLTYTVTSSTTQTNVATTGTAYIAGTTPILCAVNEIPIEGTFTLTPSGGIV